MTSTWKKKPEERESLFIAEQNDVIRTNYIEAKINNLQKNNNCRLFSDRYYIDNHLSEGNKLTESKYKSRNSLGTVQETIIWPCT